MIVLLLLCFITVYETHAAFKPCPEDSSCLYHARCDASSPNADVVLTTTDAAEYDEWKDKHCNERMEATAELFIRPLSKLLWNVSLDYTFNNLTMGIGNTIRVMANQQKAFVRIGDDHVNANTTNEKGEAKLRFQVVSYRESLVSMLSDAYIYYTERDVRNMNSKQPIFWSQLQLLTPCDASLIIDDCVREPSNCSTPSVMSNSVSCKKGEGSMWLKPKSYPKKWQKLEKVSCHKTNKAWLLSNEKGSFDESIGQIAIRCAVEDPSHCDDSVIIDGCTGLTQNCTSPNLMKNSVTCEEDGGKMWVNADDEHWQQLINITCDRNTYQWKLTNENEKSIAPSVHMKIRCADEKPEPDVGPIAPIATLSSYSNDILHVLIMPIVLYFVLM